MASGCCFKVETKTSFLQPIAFFIFKFGLQITIKHLINAFLKLQPIKNLIRSLTCLSHATGTRLALTLVLLATASAYGQVTLPALVRDSMILQRDVPLPIWGWAAPGEKVAVTVSPGATRSTRTNAEGRWQVVLPPLKSGGPYTIRIVASNTVVLSQVLAGDVWLCAGQSNMVHTIGLHQERYRDELAHDHYPAIRQFYIAPTADLHGPRTQVMASRWRPATGRHLLSFSAVAYSFARQIHLQHQVPVGIINASVGGTPIEAWISAEGLQSFPDITATILANRDTTYVKQKLAAERNAQEIRQRNLPVDAGLTATPPWFDPAFNATGWRRIAVPGYWEDQGLRNLNGVVWYRRTLRVSPQDVHHPAQLLLGRMVDADEVYINGRRVGHTTYQYPQRRYPVPAGTLIAGDNVLVVRVTNHDGKGGMVPDKPYRLETAHDTLDLTGYWHYAVGAVYPPTPVVPRFSLQNQPTALYQGMIAPLLPYRLKGVLWYQGESNIARASEYQPLLEALVHDWRRQFQLPDLPVVWAQLPNFSDYDYLPVESAWAVLRDAQRKALRLPHTGMAVTIDLGEWNDIHPDNKRTVGERLARAAQPVAYGQQHETFSGPLYLRHEVRDSTIILYFQHTGRGLTSLDGGALDAFDMAGDDGKFVRAHARIEDDHVQVWHPDVKAPRHVRYAWADNPPNPNLGNLEGLPASPFRTGL